MNNTLMAWYLDLREHMVEIVELITNAFLGVPIYYLNIMPRPWWGKHSRIMASYLDYYMDATFKGIVGRLDFPDAYVYQKLFMRRSREFRDNILPGFMTYDRVHLNNQGYHILTDHMLTTAGQRLYVPRYGPGSGAKPKRRKVAA